MVGFFRKQCRFIAGAMSLEALPPMGLPEVAMIGRSNVGKSSLINALVGQNSLARTSQRPGHTRQLNFFDIGETLVLVDMPGYGFAKVSKQEKKLWQELMKGYLRGRANLKRVCLLVDARRGIKESDKEFMAVLDDAAVTYQIVLTKCDTIKQAELTELLQNVSNTLKSHVGAYPEPLATSIKDKTGIEALREEIAGLVE